MEKAIDDIVEKYRKLKESSFYPFEIKDSDSGPIRKKKEYTRQKFESIRQEIEAYTAPQTLESRFRKNVLKAVEVLLEITQKSNTGSPLDRNQGLVIENFVFGKFAGVISDSLKNGFGIYYPNFYYQPGGNFDETDLRNLLLEFQDRLNKQFHNYFQLEACVEEYIEKIRDLWNKEDEKLANGSPV